MLSAANLWTHDLFTVRFYTANQGALNPQKTYELLLLSYAVVCWGEGA